MNYPHTCRVSWLGPIRDFVVGSNDGNLSYLNSCSEMMLTSAPVSIWNSIGTWLSEIVTVQGSDSMLTVGIIRDFGCSITPMNELSSESSVETTFTVLVQHTNWKWPCLWHFRQIVSRARDCCLSTCERFPHLLHTSVLVTGFILWNCFDTGLLMTGLSFLLRNSTASMVDGACSALTTFCWFLTDSLWQALVTAFSSVRSASSCSFSERLESQSPTTILSRIILLRSLPYWQCSDKQ